MTNKKMKPLIRNAKKKKKKYEYKILLELDDVS